jgi:hypothetical protein
MLETYKILAKNSILTQTNKYCLEKKIANNKLIDMFVYTMEWR